MGELADPALALTPLERRRGLVAAIAAVTVFGLSIGQGSPLMSLILEAHGTDATLNALNAAAAFPGVLLGPLLAPRFVRRLGIRDFLLGCFAVDLAAVLLMKRFETIAAWFVLRFALGVVGSGIFTASEAWINLLAEDATRGRTIGIYAAALAGGFAIGPLLIAATGIGGWPPFLVNAAITAAAALPLLGVGNLARTVGRERGAGMLAVFVRAPSILLAVGLFGLYEAALMSLLPIWGVRIGLPTRLAAACVSACYFGAIALQVPIGALSDRIARRSVLLLCGAVGCVGATLVSAAAAVGWVPLLLALLFVWGGAAAGIYPVALGMAGERFRGGELVGINAGIIMAYGLGAMLGPPLGGVAMDVRDPQGLMAFFVVVFVVFVGAMVVLVSYRPTVDAFCAKPRTIARVRPIFFSTELASGRSRTAMTENGPAAWRYGGAGRTGPFGSCDRSRSHTSTVDLRPRHGV